jgi:hypothetical protein
MKLKESSPAENRSGSLKRGGPRLTRRGAEDAQRKYIDSHYDPNRGILGADPAVEVIFNYELNDEHYPALAGKDDGWGLTYGPEGKFGKKAAYHEFKKLLAADPP